MNTKLMIVILITILSSLSCVSSFEYQVAWAVPPPNDTSFFNHWASLNRFLIGDSIRFIYKKDSVMEVGKDEYKDCNSSRPIFFSNTGNSVCQLNQSGYFYFISGVSPHCHNGLKLILKVLDLDLEPQHNTSPTSLSLSSSFLFLLLLSSTSFFFIL